MASSRPARRFDWGNLRLRVLSAAVLAPAVVGVVWLGGPPFLVMVAAAVAVLAMEWGRMSAPEKPLRTSIAIALAVLTCAVVAASGHPWLAWALLPLAAIVAALVAQVRDLIERPVDAAFGVLYIGAPSLALIWLRSGEVGRDWTLMLLAIAWSADIFAFVAGSILKGPKLWPRISPNKTWSGLAGGLAASALAAMLVVGIAKGEGDPTRGWAAMIGLAVGLFTMAGDLLESMLKRRFGVKDTSQLIPGHGGLLDRVDGLMFAILAMATARLVGHVTGYL